MVPLKKIYIETTTRCNLQCSKCIKQTEGHEIFEGDMTLSTYARLLPDLASVERLVLNGIGEPLLHPDLEQMISLARSVMGESADIGFQTNGHLLSDDRARRLLEAGLDNVCFSLDRLDPRPAGLLAPEEPSAELISRAIQGLRDGADAVERPLSIGLEVVVDMANIENLPEIVEWAAGNEIDYVLVSHLFPYDADMARNSLFSAHNRTALEIFSRWQTKAEDQGVDLQAWMMGLRRFASDPDSRAARNLFNGMTREAAGSGVRLNLESLFEHDPSLVDRVTAIFAEAKETANRTGLELDLPELAGLEERECTFIREGALFVAFNGDVMPCHFLWHTYPCMSGTGTVLVHKRSLGNVESIGLADIWKSSELARFRQTAGSDNVSSCWTCPQGPCDDLVNTNTLGAHDCYGSEAPCGHCLWNLGALKCM